MVLISRMELEMIKPKNPYSSNHLQKGALDCGKNIVKNNLNL